MTIEHVVIAMIVGCVFFLVIRSLVRSWRGESDGGCAGCPGCELRNHEDTCCPSKNPLLSFREKRK